MAVGWSLAATVAPVSDPKRGAKTARLPRLSTWPARMNCIAYLSYGTGRHQYEVAHSASTARRFAPPVAEPANAFCIKVITDTPLFFHRLGIDAVEVSASTINDWRGPMDYGVRGKIKAMQLLFTQGAAKVILVDGDTFFLDDPSKLFRRLGPGNSLMYEQECPLADARIPDYHLTAEKLESSPVYDSNGARLTCGRRTMQWNSGVVGLFRHDAHLLTDVLAVIDELLSRFKVWTIEQTAFSIVLQQRTRLSGAYRTIYHYNAHPGRLEFGEQLRKIIDAGPSVTDTDVAIGVRPKAPRRFRAEMKRICTACHVWGSVMRGRRIARTFVTGTA
jgi:hypothetical protein